MSTENASAAQARRTGNTDKFFARIRPLMTVGQWEQYEYCCDNEQHTTDEIVDEGMRLALGDHWREHVAALNSNND